MPHELVLCQVAADMYLEDWIAVESLERCFPAPTPKRLIEGGPQLHDATQHQHPHPRAGVGYYTLTRRLGIGWGCSLENSSYAYISHTIQLNRIKSGQVRVVFCYMAFETVRPKILP